MSKLEADDVLLVAGFVLAVTGGAMVYPPLALIVAAFAFLALWFVRDRRPPDDTPGS